MFIKNGRLPRSKFLQKHEKSWAFSGHEFSAGRSIKKRLQRLFLLHEKTMNFVEYFFYFREHFACQRRLYICRKRIRNRRTAHPYAQLKDK
jgi:hypothetical protein